MKQKSYSDSSFPRRVLGMALIVIMSYLPLQAVESPLVIPFQGQITNQQNVLVASGQYSIIFNLYAEAVGGQPIWTERHTKVGVSAGMVNVFLGSITSMTQVDFSQTRYLGITIDVDDKPTTPDPEMVPRQMIIPAFHAKNAEKLAGADWSSVMTTNDPATGFIKTARIAANTITNTQLVSSAVSDTKIATGAVTNTKIGAGAVTNDKMAVNSVNSSNIQDGSITAADLSTDVTTPAGSVVAYVGDVAPTGWLLCNGADVSRTTYPALALVVAVRFGTAAAPATNFKLPDFRGYFLRGVDGAAGRDPDKAARTAMASGGALGNAVGSVQVDEIRSHNHAPPIGLNLPWVSNDFTGDGAIDGSAHTGPGENSHIGGNTQNTGGNETRPMNAYVNYIIKY